MATIGLLAAAPVSTMSNMKSLTWRGTKPLVSCARCGWVSSVHNRMQQPRYEAMCGRRRALLSFFLASSACLPLPSLALPAECLNGMMEQRQYLGIDPFAPPCNVVDPGPLPIFPIMTAKITLDALLAEPETFRELVRLGRPTGSLQVAHATDSNPLHFAVLGFA